MQAAAAGRSGAWLAGRTVSCGRRLLLCRIFLLTFV